MYKVSLIIFLLISIFLIIVIMLQNKKYDIGLTFSTHNLSNILSSSTNNGNIMIKLTIILAILFFLFSLLLANLIKDVRNENNILQPLKRIKCLKQNINK